MSIYVGNISFDVNEEDVKEIFSEYGSVQKVHLPTDRDTGRMRGFGFVDMENEAQEEAAITALNGAEWCGRSLKVNKSRPREERNSSRRGGGGRGSW